MSKSSSLKKKGTYHEKSSPKSKITIAIITIYRNDSNNIRKKQKDVFLEKINFLKKYGDFDIYLIEQSCDNCNFNIGKLKNIGFKLANDSQRDYDFFIFTDIDILPDKSLAPYYFKPIKGVSCLGHRGTRYQQSSPASKCFMGSCLGFDAKSFKKINGYPNNFWGWGGEDESILIRCNLNNIPIFIPKIGSIKDLEQTPEGGPVSLKKKLSQLKKLNLKETRKDEKQILETKIWKKNGLANLEYQTKDNYQLSKSKFKLYYWLVDLNYRQDHLKHVDWFDFSSFEKMSYKQLKETKKKKVNKYKGCHPIYY